MTFTLTDKQKEAVRLIGSDASHVLLYGGSRSGKTFLSVRAVIARACYRPGRHLMARFRLSHIKASVVADTFPRVMKECFETVAYDHSKTDGLFKFPNGSEVWYAGVDDKDRTEKILGQEYLTIFLNECSQIPWASRGLLITRLAQKVEGMRNKALYDENPPLRSHWTHRLFIEKRDPDTGKPLANPENFGSLLINPYDNKANIGAGYLNELDHLGARARKRFRDGIFGDAGESALWSIELIEQQTIADDFEVPQMVKIVVAVDPSGARGIDDADRDEIGICVAGLGTDGEVYIMEDLTMKGSPEQWGKAVVNAYRRHEANTVVGEVNFGGDMVRSIIQSAALDAHQRHLPVHYQAVTASRGKVVRAEPISALCEQQRLWLFPGLDKLGDELCNFTTSGYVGERSPNRADAMIWAATALHGRAISEGRAQGAAMYQRQGQGPRVVTGHNRWKRSAR